MFQQPEWKYFHAKWKFLTKNSPILYYTLECDTGPSSVHRTCKSTVEKEGLYEARVDVEEDGSLVLRDVQPEDAGKYEIHVLAMDEFARAEVELVVTEGLPSLESVSLPPRTISAAVNGTAWLPIHLQSLRSAWTFLSIKWEVTTTTNRNISILVYLIGNCSKTIGEWWEKECTVHKEVAGEYQRRVDIFRNGTLVIYSVGLKDAGIYQATIRAAGVEVQAAVNLAVTQGEPFKIDPRGKPRRESTVSWEHEDTEPQGTSGSLTRENTARFVLAGLLLCFLGLLIGEQGADGEDISMAPVHRAFSLPWHPSCCCWADPCGLISTALTRTQHVWATISPRPTSQLRKDPL
ncbi:UNVERIFIED_CONTAM: hypothetical protein K2H54_002573 [Gekko kuhli]